MEPTAYVRFFLALVLVLGLILGMTWIMKRMGLGGGVGPLTRRRRLRTVESVSLDGRHRAVLVRRDDVEHLILLGPNTSQVIERGIPAVETPEPQASEVTPPMSAFRKLLAKDDPQ